MGLARQLGTGPKSCRAQGALLHVCGEQAAVLAVLIPVAYRWGHERMHVDACGFEHVPGVEQGAAERGCARVARGVGAGPVERVDDSQRPVVQEIGAGQEVLAQPRPQPVVEA